jgi:type II secretory pathway predicted ATPase ExeA
MIAYRLAVAGSKESPFNDDAALEVYRLSLGLPRQVCQVCEMALLAGYAGKQSQIDVEAVRSAAAELRLAEREGLHAG